MQLRYALAVASGGVALAAREQLNSREWYDVPSCSILCFAEAITATTPCEVLDDQYCHCVPESRYLGIQAYARDCLIKSCGQNVTDSMYLSFMRLNAYQNGTLTSHQFL